MRRSSLVGFLLAIATLPTGCDLSEECGDRYCNGTVMYSCELRGEAIRSTHWSPMDCADSGRYCVSGFDDELGQIALCSDSSEPDPRCEGGDTCDGNTLIHCLAGYVEVEIPCESECITEPFVGCVDPYDPCFGRDDGWICANDEARRCSSWKTTTWPDPCPGCMIDENGSPVRLEGDRWVSCS